MSEAQSFDWRELATAGRNLWLAGLGVVAEVEEGGRELFDRLVERGRPLERQQRTTIEEVGERSAAAVRDLGKLVQDTMEYETKGVLRRLGLLTRDDVRTLAARLDTLSGKIDEISARQEIPQEIPQEISQVQPAAKRQPRQRKQ
jgi:poly(hydroxyalkanoate) granule-associated protein